MCKVVVVYDVFPEFNVLMDYSPRKVYASVGRFLSLLNLGREYFNLYYVLGPAKRSGVMSIDNYGRASFVFYIMCDIPVVYRVVNVSFDLVSEDKCFVKRVIAPFFHEEEVAFVDRIVKRGKEVRVGLDLGVSSAYETVFRVWGARAYAKVYRVEDLPKPEEIRAIDWKEKIGMVENMKTKHKEG